MISIILSSRSLISSSVKSKSESHSVVYNSLQSQGLYIPWNSPGQNNGVSSHSLLQGIFPTQGSNLGLRHCRWILYQLSPQGSPVLCLLHLIYLFNIFLTWKKPHSVKNKTKMEKTRPPPFKKSGAL